MRAIKYKRIQVLQIGTGIILILFIIASVIGVKIYHSFIRQQIEEQRKRDELHETRHNEITDKLEDIMGGVTEVIAGVDEIYENVDYITGRVNLIAGRVNTIVGRVAGIQEDMASELAVTNESRSHDYAQRALEYYFMEDYANAYAIFSRALRYQRDNNTIRFFQIYSFYIWRTRNGELNSGEIVYIQQGISEINERGFIEQNMILYSPDEMQEKLNNMELDIEYIRRQNSNHELETFEEES